MLFDEFVRATNAFWTEYFGYVVQEAKKGHLRSDGAHVLFPSMMIASKFGRYYVCELVGAVSNFDVLRIKKHIPREASIYTYLDQFGEGEPDPAIKLDVVAKRPSTI